MTTSSHTNGLYRLADKINAHLIYLRSGVVDRRPEASTRRKVATVAYQAAGGFEVTDTDGHTTSITIDQAKAMLS